MLRNPVGLVCPWTALVDDSQVISIVVNPSRIKRMDLNPTVETFRPRKLLLRQKTKMPMLMGNVGLISIETNTTITPGSHENLTSVASVTSVARGVGGCFCHDPSF